ncbi:MAG: hypothetical protein J7K87_04485 [Candidatus Aenigmarchaeota archaeon]|nr:hypothetical protein [Candidatus Aenigmarchaeota archaeon]
MLKWLRSKRKAQFFIISMVIIMAVLAGIQTLFAGYSEVDISKPYSSPEDFWFWNIKDQVTRALEERSCPDLEADFIEIKMSTENYLSGRGVEFNLTNTTPICDGNVRHVPTGIFMNMTSANVNLHKEFKVP